jgi:hypothetical protein
VLLASLLVGIGLGLALRPPRAGIPLPSPAVAPIGMAVAVAAALLVAAHWAMPTQTGLDIGMYLPNTTWHNAPFAARFVQDHQVGALDFTEVLDLTVWFYPQNSELVHSAGVLFLGNDFLSPLINIGWMSLCLLAAWAFARPYGGGPIAVLALALVLDANMLLLYQPGDAKNDTAGLFFLLASAAVLVNADAQRRLAVGGAAEGASAGALSPPREESAVRNRIGGGSRGVPAAAPIGVASAGRDLYAAQALIRIAAAARSIATGTVSVAGVPASRGTIGPVSIAMQTATRLSGATR